MSGVCRVIRSKNLDYIRHISQYLLFSLPSYFFLHLELTYLMAHAALSRTAYQYVFVCLQLMYETVLDP